jgi:hypothetical protein
MSLFCCRLGLYSISVFPAPLSLDSLPPTKENDFALFGNLFTPSGLAWTSKGKGLRFKLAQRERVKEIVSNGPSADITGRLGMASVVQGWLSEESLLSLCG